MLQLFPKPLPPNSEAPDFSMIDQHSQTQSLEKLKAAQKGAILYFFSNALNPLVQGAFNAFNDHYEAIQNKGYEVIAVHSLDWVRHHHLAKKHQWQFPIAFDPRSQTSRKYGACLIKTFINHNLVYVINAQGQITLTNKGIPRVSQLLELI